MPRDKVTARATSIAIALTAALTSAAGAPTARADPGAAPRAVHDRDRDGDFDYDRHVVFDNSRGARSYYFSQASAVAPSHIEAVRGRLPALRDRCVTPPSCLRLRWRSRPGGAWQTALAVMKQWGSQHPVGDTLSFWARSAEGLAAEDAPRIHMVDAAGQGTPDIRLLGARASIPAGQWVQIRLPLSSFTGSVRGTSDAHFEPTRIASIQIVQGLDDGRPHTLDIDEVAITSDRQDRAGSAPPAAPSALAASGSDRHIDLTWRPPPGGGVRHYVIYRATDGTHYRAIATQKGHLTRFVDFLGRSGAKASYRVSAVDTHFRESARSGAAAATTRALSDDDLLTMVQRACFRYYWEAAHPVAGMALEIIPGDPDLVALGASGFGIMAIIVGAERGFVTREQAVQRMVKIVRFLDRADRFHGVWPHYLDGRTGRTIAHFGKYDDGADLVETAFLMQGLLAARQYYGRDTPGERELRATITRFWRTVEWDWHARGPDRHFLYWHWSPRYGFHIQHPLIGWNETMIVYLLAIASPTHAVPASMYHTGWAGQSDTAVRYRQGWGRTTAGDHYTNGHTYHGIHLDVGVGNGAELFFTMFSFMGFDPRGKRDRYTNYFENSRAIALIDRAYAIDNPRKRVGYGPDAWGFSAGVNSGGGRPLPRDDNGTINIHAALGAFPYTPVESMRALRHFYRDLGDRVWGIYGFHDGFNQTDEWFEPVYMGLDQAPIVVMIENHRSGLVWKSFMATPEIAPALEAIGFRPDVAAPRR